MDYKGLLDMIDGGGAGRAGQQFEGGGLLSAIANMVATPYGSQDRMRSQARPDDFRQRFKPPIQSPQPMQHPAPQQSPLEMFGGQAPNSSPIPVQQSPLEMFGGQPPAPYTPPLQYSGRGAAGMPMPQFATTPEQQQVVEYLRSMGLLNY